MSNIYLNEFDRLMMHELKPFAYLRYGDDWLCFANSSQAIEDMRVQATAFLHNELSLTINPKINRVFLALDGVSYLGVNMWPHGRKLQGKVRSNIIHNISAKNSASYKALIASHDKHKKLKELNWLML